MRHIPVTMATQHPDNINPAYFNNKAFISTSDEIEEAYLSRSELGTDEYMWDWEWKFVDESVVEKLFRQHADYFEKNRLWRDKFLTYRIPNIRKESGHRLMRAFMNIISITEFAKELWYDDYPVFEVILPMTESADQMIYIKEKFKKLAQIMPDLMEHKFFHTSLHIEVIPLFEEVPIMINSVPILEKYADMVTKTSGKKPEYLRVFLARSDPAMNVGIIPSVLWVKAAISQYRDYEKKSWIKIYPWLGWWSLPFRGNVSPDRIDDTINEYKGLDSITIQSSFRYDHPLETVKEAIHKLNTELPKHRDQYNNFSDEDIQKTQQVHDIGIAIYSKTIEHIADMINQVASSVPKRRERMLHIGLFGYSRWIGETKLPRAIWFTASLYSLGIPPELIGTGRLIKELQAKWLLIFVEEKYINIKKDLAFAYKYLNKDNLMIASKQNPAFDDIIEDVRIIETYLWELADNTSWESIAHQQETSSVMQLMLAWKDFKEPLINAAKIRKSLG